MKIELTAITVYLDKAKKVLCVRCNFTGRFMKRIIGINALNALELAKTKAKQAVLKNTYSFLAVTFYSLAILLPFVLCVIFNIKGMNIHDSILAASLLAMFFSTILMLIGCQFSDCKQALINKLNRLA